MPKTKPDAVPMPELHYALSVKQPWAALIVHGLKTVEVRSWPANRRGTLLIHASKSPEPNPAAWALATDADVAATAQITGGVIGVVDLVDAIVYRTLAEFTADAGRHRAGPEWFAPVRHGFVLANPRRVEFIKWPGNTNFFGVTALLKVIKARKPRPKRTPKPAMAQVVRLPEQGPVRKTKSKSANTTTQSSSPTSGRERSVA